VLDGSSMLSIKITIIGRAGTKRRTSTGNCSLWVDKVLGYMDMFALVRLD
jgi:hypothetical protein